MNRNQECFLCLGVSILALLTLSPALPGQVLPDHKKAVAVTDWTHHHVVFSRPATAEQARRVEQDPRYWQQRSRQLSVTRPEAKKDADPFDLQPSSNVSLPGENHVLKRDWLQDIGNGGTVGATNYPAKYSLNTTTANCAGAPQPDFVAYTTGLVGGARADIVAYDNLYSGCSGLDLGTAANFAMLASSTITSTGASVVTGGNIGISPGTSLTGFPPGVLTAPAVKHLGDVVAAQAEADANTAYTFYQGLAGATTIAPLLDGLTFTPGLYNASGTLTLSAGQTVTLNGNGTYVFQIGSTLEIAGTVVLSGGATAGNVIWLVGSSATIDATGIAVGDIVALTSITLDSGAPLTGRAIALNGAVTMIDNAVTTVDTVPSVYWAYDTGAAIFTSPVFSRDGTQLAYVQSNGVPQGVLVLLRWAASTTETIASPLTLPHLLPGAYPGCMAPCMTTWRLTDGSGAATNDTNSSVFYDYSNDVAYVGDDAGWLHKFTPVFLGIPAEVRTGGWPVQVSTTALNSPVQDFATGNVFVTDNGGFLYLVDPTGAVTISGQLDFSLTNDLGPGIVQGPVVDSTSGLVYVYAPSDGTGLCNGGTDCTAVYQLTTSFASGDFGSEAVVGASTLTGNAPSPLYIGAFDSTYVNSVDGTGNLYVCGNTGGDPVLYQVAMTAGAFGTVTAGPLLSTSFTPTPCSPVTDILNPNVSGGATEWMFASVQNGGASPGCAAGGCVFNFKDTPWLASTSYIVGQEVLDSNFQIQVVSVAGTSGLTAPTWSTTAGNPTVDGTVVWLDQGVQSASTPSWAAAHLYATGNKILDGNNNTQVVTTPGFSGGSMPTFNPTAGGTTIDGVVVWTNVGPLGTAALAAAGGTSGIIIDNTVISGTLAGTSQIYFSTLTNEVCGTSGTGGCAVQASQPALQ
ncbi:MAG TPA: ice-binding family protein [Candidatus Dormibacteraeota bacterium]|jgi:hypothetical protein|nr:ice-binding family protein [Candidatus Dormibacteraeota bacterium]